MIPKLIHQTWKTTEIPDNWKNAVESCKHLHDDYEYILWTHDTMKEFMKQEYPEYYDLYMSYKFDIQRCDAFRYFVLYKYGGIYFDLDTVCKKKLNDFLSYDMVFAKSTNASTFSNAFFMCIPQNPFMKYCIDNLESYKNSHIYFGKHLHVMFSAGPCYLSIMIKKFKLSNINNHYILSREEYSGDCNVCTIDSCQGGAYFNHIKGQSWNSFDSLSYNFIYCKYRILLVIFFTIIFLVLIYKYYRKKRMMIQ